MELFPSYPSEGPEPTVRQFEKFSPVFRYLDQSRTLRRQLFESYFEQSPFSDEIGRVEVRDEHDRLIYNDLGLGVRCHEPYKQNLLQKGSYQDLLLVKRISRNCEDYLAIWQKLNFNKRGLSGFEYGVLELHNSGLVDYIAESISLKPSDIEELYRGQFGPFCLEPHKSEYEPHKYAIRINRSLESSVPLSVMNDGFSQAKFTDDGLLNFIAQKANEQNQGISDFEPWLIRRYKDFSVI